MVKPGSGFNINPATLDPKAVADYAGQAKAQSVTDFLMHIIPNTVVDAFAKGDITTGRSARNPVRFCASPSLASARR